MENGKEIMKSEAEEVLPLVVRESSLITADVIRQMEAQVDGLNKIKTISLRLTNKSDWMVMDGKPCLANSGCMKIANLWGVSFNSPEVNCETITDDKGEYKLFTCSGRAEFRGRTVEDIGTSSTRDKLLGRVGGGLRPLSEVDLPSVKKMSVTNWQSRILKKILGLAFEMEDLKAAGINVEKGYSHAGGGEGGGLISQPQANRLFAISKSAKLSEDSVKSIIKGFGYEHSKDIKRTDYEAICKMVEDKGKALAAFDKEGQQPGD